MRRVYFSSPSQQLRICDAAAWLSSQSRGGQTGSRVEPESLLLGWSAGRLRALLLAELPGHEEDVSLRGVRPLAAQFLRPDQRAGTRASRFRPTEGATGGRVELDSAAGLFVRMGQLRQALRAGPTRYPGAVQSELVFMGFVDAHFQVELALSLDGPDPASGPEGSLTYHFAFGHRGGDFVSLAFVVDLPAV